MKRLFLIAGLTTAFVLAAVAVSAGSAANFGGTWVMDKAKSQGLDPRMQNAESVSCVIVQDDKTLSIEWKVVAGQPPAGRHPVVAAVVWAEDVAPVARELTILTAKK